MAVVGDFHLKTLEREFISINIRNDLVVFDDEDFLHSHVLAASSASLARCASRKVRMRANSRFASWQSWAALVSFSSNPWRSNSRKKGTSFFMPQVALAPAQL